MVSKEGCLSPKLLLCGSFEIPQQNLLTGVSELLLSFVKFDTIPNDVLIEYYCMVKDLNDDVNRSILRLTFQFIHQTGWFDYDNS